MSCSEDGDEYVLRMNVRLDRDEFPDLFYELRRISKGMKRTQRLKRLASERLLLTHGRALGPDMSESALNQQTTPIPAAREEDVAAANELFLPPIK